MSSRTNQVKYRNISLITVFLLLISFSYYYFIYVKSNEQKFNDKAFRIIENIGDNIENKFDNYSTTVQNALNHLLKYEVDSLTSATTENVGKLLYKYGMPEELEVVVFEIEPEYLENRLEKLVINSNLNGDSVTIELKNSFYKLNVRYRVEYLLANTLRRNFFKEFILFNKNQIFYSDIPVDRSLREIKIDSVFKKEKGELINLFHSTDRVELEFENNPQLMYTRPLNFSNNETLYIGGIVEKEFYRQQSFSLGTNTMVGLIIILFLVILSLPFIKIGLISENERVFSKDVLFGFTVLLIGAGFVVLGMLTYFGQSGPLEKKKNQYLIESSKAIQTNFFSELKDILDQISENEKVLGQINPDLGLKEKFRYDLKITDSNYPSITSIYPAYSNMMWIGNSGQQLVKWQSKPTSRVNVSSRAYFQIPREKGNNLWSDPSVNEPDGFYVGAIMSVTEGKTYAAVSKKSLSEKELFFDDDVFDQVNSKQPVIPSVVAMVTKLQSLENLPVSDDISYLVIDENGQVLFHKNQEKILRENLLNELTDKVLRQSIITREDTTFVDSYDESLKRFYMSPIGKLPLFLLTYSDESEETKINANIFLLTSLLLFVMIGLVLTQVFLFVFINTETKYKTRGNNYFANWLWPDQRKVNSYLLLVVYLLAAILLFFFGEFYNDVLLTLSFFSLLVTANLFVLRGFTTFSDFINDTSNTRLFFFFAGMVLFSFWIFLYADIGLMPVSTVVFFLVFVVISFLTMLSCFVLGKSKKLLKLPLIYNTWFFILLFSLSICSVYGFYTRTFNLEKSIQEKHRQLSLAKKISDNFSLFPENKYKDHVSLNPTYSFTADSIGELPELPHETRLFKHIRKAFSENDESTSFFGFTKRNQAVPFFWNQNEEFLQLNFPSVGTDNETGRPLVITSEKITFKPGSILFSINQLGSYEMLLLISIFFFLALFYFLVKYWTRRVFLLGAIPNFKTSIDQTTHDRAAFNYVISPPYSGVINYYEKLYHERLHIVDYRYAELSKGDIPVTFREITKVVLIIDFETISLPAIKQKIALIERLKKLIVQPSQHLNKIIIVSTFNPQELSLGVDGNDKEYAENVVKYLELLGDFTTTYFPIGYSEDETESFELDYIQMELSLVLSANKNLHILHSDNADYDNEDALLTIQNRAQLFYYSIWNSCEKRERLVIYDLAQDGFVNYRNQYVIYNLLNRGILVNRGNKIELFSQSFLNFVLTIIDREKSLEIEYEAKKTGSWSNMKLPIYLIIGGAVVFVLLTQQNIFSELFGWLTAVVTMLPLITKILTSFSFGKAAEKK